MRLPGVPVVSAQGEQDTVIPRELLDRTRDYLLGESGAPTTARRDPVGHGIAAEALATFSGWLTERLSFLASHGRPTPGAAIWPTLPGGELPQRTGPRPAVSHRIPQEQCSDKAPRALQEQVFTRVAALPGVTTTQSAISVPGARGFMLTDADRGPDAAFLVPAAGEFAHVQPGHDAALHLALPMPLATDDLAKGWGVAHPLAGVRVTPGMVMLFGPRDTAELETVIGVVAPSHAGAASGQFTDLATRRTLDWRRRGASKAAHALRERMRCMDHVVHGCGCFDRTDREPRTAVGVVGHDLPGGLLHRQLVLDVDQPGAGEGTARACARRPGVHRDTIANLPL